MDNDLFEKLNKFGRREVLTIIPFAGEMVAITFLLNTFSLAAGIKKSRVKFSWTGIEFFPKSCKVLMEFLYCMMFQLVKLLQDLPSLFLVGMLFLFGETADWNLNLHLRGKQKRNFQISSPIMTKYLSFC